jgi:hypothetical protein
VNSVHSAQEAISREKYCNNHCPVNSDRVNCSLNNDLINKLTGILIKKSAPLTVQ